MISKKNLIKIKDLKAEADENYEALANIISDYENLDAEEKEHDQDQMLEEVGEIIEILEIMAFLLKS